MIYSGGYSFPWHEIFYANFTPILHKSIWSYMKIYLCGLIKKPFIYRLFRCFMEIYRLMKFRFEIPIPSFIFEYPPKKTFLKGYSISCSKKSLIQLIKCTINRLVFQHFLHFFQGNRTKNELIFLLSDSLMKDVIYSSSPKKAQKSPFSPK